jgi:hypothetical protein
MMIGRAWQVLRTMDAWQVTQIPRRPQVRDNPATDQGLTQRLQGLVSAFHYGAPVAFGWLREQPGGQVRVLAAGPGLTGGADGDQAVLTLPVGARARPLPAGRAAALLAEMPCWVRLAGITDALLLDGRDRDKPDARPSLEEGLLSAWTGPFAWLVLAEPVAASWLAELTDGISLAQQNAQRLDSPRAQLAAKRLSARHAELRQAAATGLWQVRVVAGAREPHAAAQVAGLLCASADLDGLPYALAPASACAALEQTLDDEPATHKTQNAQNEEPAPTTPFYASSRLVAALARPPAREVPGIRFVLRPDFDVTPETTEPTDIRDTTDTTDTGSKRIPLGTVLDWNRLPSGELAVTQASLNRHTFVCGATGAGKSQTVRGLLEAATGAGIPWLVVEPAKAEYRLMAARLPGIQVIRIRPGDLDDSPAGINPLEPAAGPDGARFPLQTHADLVRALFLAAFEADEPFPQVLAAALTRCYENAGWDLVTGEPIAPGDLPGYPVLEDLQATAMQVVEQIGYGREITDNVRGFVAVRISSLRLGTTGRFLQGGHPLDFTALLKHNVVLEIEDTGDDRDKAFLMGTVLIRLVEHLRLRQRAEGPANPRLRHLSVFEEAHRLLRKPAGPAEGAASHAVEMFAGLLAEIRAYGEGLIIAEQIPAKLIQDVIKNTAVKIVHRLPAADDRQAVGATMNLTEDQSAYLVTLTPGEAAVFTDGMDYPVLARMPDGTGREIAHPAAAGSPVPLISSRSPACGPECARCPCTLRQIRAAQHAALRDPRITTWAELSVLAHLTGWIMPVPGPAFAEALATMETRLRDCALSHATDAAVAARITAGKRPAHQGPAHKGPARQGTALAVHVTAAMRAVLDDHRWLCDQREPRWLAPPYRWALVLDSLRARHNRDPAAGPHPDTAEWEATYQRAIPGQTCADQLDTVQRWHDADQRDHQQLRAIAYGTHPGGTHPGSTSNGNSAIELAVGASASDPDWEPCLAEALAEFRDCRWPLDHLRPETSRSSGLSRNRRPATEGT